MAIVPHERRIVVQCLAGTLALNGLAVSSSNRRADAKLAFTLPLPIKAEAGE